MMGISAASCIVSRHFHRYNLLAKWFTPILPPMKHFQTSLRHSNPITESSFNASLKRSTKLKMKDNVSKDYTLIYKAPMELALRTGYSVILFCSVAIPTCIIYEYTRQGKIVLAKEAYSKKFINPELEIWVFGGVMYLCALAAFAVIFKFPLRVYKHSAKQEYIAMFVSAMPSQLRQIHFKSASKTKFKNPLYFFMDDCHYFIDRKKAFLLTHYFRVPADLCDMLGID